MLRWTRTVFPSGDTARRFGSKGALTLPRIAHPARRGVEHLNRDLRAWRPGLNEAIGFIPIPPAAAGTVVHAGPGDSPAQESYAGHDLTRFPPVIRNGQEWRRLRSVG